MCVDRIRLRKRNNIGTYSGVKAIGWNRPRRNGIDKPETRSSTQTLARTRIGLGAVTLLSVLALAFFGSVMRSPLMAASAGVNSAWGKVLIAGGFGASGPASSTELYDPATNSFAAADTAAMNTGRIGAQAILLPLTPGGVVTLLPSTLDFGAIVIGQHSAAQTITLSNGTGKKITIRGTAIGIDYKIVSTTCSSALKPGQSCNYIVSFRSGQETKMRHFESPQPSARKMSTCIE
jgi:hypothetical protein